MDPPVEQPRILWSCVARNDVVFAEARLESSFDDSEGKEDSVARAAKKLLGKRETPGFEFTTTTCKTRLWGGRKLKGMKFHIHDHRLEGIYHVWVFACVYDPVLIEAGHAKSFLERLIAMTETFRETEDEWKYWSRGAAQDMISPILKQHMKDATYIGKMALMNEQVENLKQIMHQNIERILERDERIEKLQENAENLTAMAKVFKKNSKDLKRRILWQKAKHGLLMGTAITAGVAVVATPLVVIF